MFNTLLRFSRNASKTFRRNVHRYGGMYKIGPSTSHMTLHQSDFICFFLLFFFFFLDHTLFLLQKSKHLFGYDLKQSVKKAGFQSKLYNVAMITCWWLVSGLIVGSHRASLAKFLNFYIIWKINSDFYFLTIYFFKYILNRFSILFFISFKYYFFIYYLFIF